MLQYFTSITKSTLKNSISCRLFQNNQLCLFDKDEGYLLKYDVFC